MRNHWIWLVVAAGLVGCPGSEPEDDKGDDDDDDAVVLDATGSWTGRCDFQGTDTGYDQDFDYFSAELDITDTDGVVTGQMTATSYYVGTTPPYPSILDVEGTRTDDQLDLVLTNATTTTTASPISIALSLTLDGDTLDGAISFELSTTTTTSGYGSYNFPTYDCSLAR